MEKLGYTVIQDWMYDLAYENNLRLAEIVCFAVVFGFSQDGESSYTGGRRYMASKMCAKDVKSVSLALNRLVSKGLILRNSIERNRVQFHEYKVPADILLKAREKITGGREKPDAPGEKMGATKIYTRYNKSIKAVKSPKAIEL